jgi:hypothetical protein
MPNGREEIRVDAPHPSQGLRVESVVLGAIGIDQPNDPRVRYHHVVLEFGEEIRHPWRVSPHLDDDTCRGAFTEIPAKTRRGGADSSLFDALASVSQNADLSPAISQIAPDGELFHVPSSLVVVTARRPTVPENGLLIPSVKVAVRGGGLGGAGSGWIVDDARRGGLRRLEFATHEQLRMSVREG